MCGFQKDARPDRAAPSDTPPRAPLLPPQSRCRPRRGAPTSAGPQEPAVRRRRSSVSSLRRSSPRKPFRTENRPRYSESRAVRVVSRFRPGPLGVPRALRRGPAAPMGPSNRRRPFLAPWSGRRARAGSNPDRTAARGNRQSGSLGRTMFLASRALIHPCSQQGRGLPPGLRQGDNHVLALLLGCRVSRRE